MLKIKCVRGDCLSKKTFRYSRRSAILIKPKSLQQLKAQKTEVGRGIGLIVISV